MTSSSGQSGLLKWHILDCLWPGDFRSNETRGVLLQLGCRAHTSDCFEVGSVAFSLGGIPGVLILSNLTWRDADQKE